MDDSPETVGDRIRKARQRRGWSQLELAKRAQVTRSSIVRIESGERSTLQLDVSLKIANALGVSVDYLARGLLEDLIGAPLPALALTSVRV